MLLVAIAAFTSVGAAAVEPLFKYVSVLLYGTYAIFLGLSLFKFGGQILGNPARASRRATAGLSADFTYAGYNAIGAVSILPVLRHMTRPRDALVAGIVAGPLAMIPGLFFFLSMIAWYPEVGRRHLAVRLPAVEDRHPHRPAAVPGDDLLRPPGERVVALVHRAHHRSARAHALRARTGSDLGLAARGGATLAVLLLSVFAAQGIGLVDLIAKGYRFMSWALIATFIIPVIAVSVLRPKYLER